jgi:hypothetical protein
LLPPRLNDEAGAAVAAGAVVDFPKRPPPLPKKPPAGGAGVLPLAGVVAASAGLEGKLKGPPPDPIKSGKARVAIYTKEDKLPVAAADVLGWLKTVIGPHGKNAKRH